MRKIKWMGRAQDKGHVPILYWDNSKGLIKEVISAEVKVRDRMWISGKETVLKRDNSQPWPVWLSPVLLSG